MRFASSVLLHTLPLLSLSVEALRHGVSSGGSTGRRLKKKECTFVMVEALEIPGQGNGGDRGPDFQCELEDGKAIPFEMSPSQKDDVRNLIKHGAVKSGEDVYDDADAIVTPKKVIVPPGKKMKFSKKGAGNDVSSSSRRRLNTARFGDSHYLVVRVIDKNGLAHADSTAVMSDNMFGTSGDAVNLKSQIYDCSAGQLNLVPGPPDSASQAQKNAITAATTALGHPVGFMEATIDVDITTAANRYDVRNAVIDKVQSILGFTLPGPFDHVVFNLEKCYGGDCGWAAYAYINSWNQVYQSDYYFMPGVQVHEYGHNLGMAHSGGLNGATYTDHTCMMGNPLYSDDVGKMCYNPAKNYYLGWYNNGGIVEFNPATSTSWSGTLMGVGQWKEYPSAYPVVVKIETGTSNDYFVGFNRAAGANAQNDEADNLVTIIETGNNGLSYSQSYLKGYIGVGATYSFDNWQGSGKSLQIFVEAINLDTNPGTAKISIALTGTNFPTSAPTPLPGCTKDTVRVALTTDNYASETSWEIKNSQGGTEYSVAGGFYPSNNTPYTNTLCLDACGGSFVIKDSYGDGICCSYGSGSYSLTVNGQAIVTNGGNYGSGETKAIDCLGGPPPSPVPTKSPTSPPTSPPTNPPPTSSPTKSPTAVPTASSTEAPTSAPTKSPTDAPTSPPSKSPTDAPTSLPSKSPTDAPTSSPSKSPTDAPTTSPTKAPTAAPSSLPTPAPSVPPTPVPTSPPVVVSSSPTPKPTDSPIANPTKLPTSSPTTNPTKSPTDSPTNNPTSAPTDAPTSAPTKLPTNGPTSVPTNAPIAPTSSPTKAPTSSPIVGGPGVGEALFAQPHPIGAPACLEIGSSCDSGDYLKGRGSKGPFGLPEANNPNTINSCPDGQSGTYEEDESVEKIVVRSGGLNDNGSTAKLVGPGKATIIATVFAYSYYQSDYADFYYAADATNPNWQYITTLQPTKGGLNDLKVEYDLPETSSLQVVRVNYRYSGATSPCSQGSWDDRDDLVFAVSVPPQPTPSPAAGPVIGPKIATYNALLGAPSCAEYSTECSSGALVIGRGSMKNGVEPNRPNTLDDCTDGNSGTFHGDESLDKVIVRSGELDGSGSGIELTENGRATIIATVYAWSSGSSDRADFYYAADASSPTWVYIGTKQPPGGGVQQIGMSFTLPQGGMQAVRVNFRYGDSKDPSQCNCKCGKSSGAYDDSDDLAFVVKSNAASVGNSLAMGIPAENKPLDTKDPKAIAQMASQNVAPGEVEEKDQEKGKKLGWEKNGKGKRM